MAKEQDTEIKKEVRRILRSFGKKRENLIPILQQIQGRLGYLPREGMLEIAKFLGIPEMNVYSVATFYNQFRLNPPGRHSIRVCVGTACHVKGSSIILDEWKRRLGIDRGQTTPDREFDLDTVACVGCCAMAPVTVVDNSPVGKMTPTKVEGVLLSHQLQKDKGEENSENRSSN